MKLTGWKTLAAGLCLAGLIGWTAFAAHDERPSSGQQTTADTQPTTAVALLQDKKEPKKKDTFKPRLPNYYGKVGVSEKQRQKIYSLQRQYHEKIAPLEQQIAELEAKRDAEIEAVLTPAQKKLLEEYREAARKKREARRKKRRKSSK